MAEDKGERPKGRCSLRGGKNGMLWWGQRKQGVLGESAQGRVDWVATGDAREESGKN